MTALMAEATYTGLDGQKVTVRYDRLGPCVACGLPVMEASVGGTALCPWCDSGYDRYGSRIVQPRKATKAEYDRAVDAVLNHCVQCGARVRSGHRWPTGNVSCDLCYDADWR